MRIVLFVNNRVGSELTRWLRARGDDIVAAVVHPPARARFRDEILASLQGVPLLDASTLGSPETIDAIARLRPQLGASLLFGYILQPALIELFPHGIVNVHPALLPYNRGANTNVWPIVDGTPAGVTLHYIDASIDTGDIIAQSEVPVALADTGESLYRKLEAESISLFQRTWPDIVAGTAARHPQPAGGTYHRSRELAELDAIDLDARYTARELLDILRARTFPPYRGAYFVRDGQKVYVSVQLEVDPDRD